MERASTLLDAELEDATTAATGLIAAVGFVTAFAINHVGG